MRLENGKKSIVGIIGGIASGKSLVTMWLKELGAHILVADQIAHSILLQKEVVDELVACFGRSILLEPECTQIDRKTLGALVFGTSEQHAVQRSRLENIVQPRIRAELQRQIDHWKATHQSGVLILDIPLLIERNWTSQCDRVLMIDTPYEKRRRFAAARGWDEAQLRARESSQLPMEDKRSFATSIIENNGTLQQLRDQVVRWWATQS